MWMVGVGLALAVGTGPMLQGAEHMVQVKKDPVVKNDQIDYNDEEATKADQVIVLGTTNAVIVISKTFVPPPDWVFLPFWPTLTNEPVTHVDIWANPEALDFRRLVDSAGAIQVLGIFMLPINAGEFPLRCEGNIKPIPRPAVGGPGGPGEEKKFHWSAKVDAEAHRIDLDADSDNNNDVLGGPNRDESEDSIEEQAPGKYIPRNDGDSDNDQMPDLVDGLGLLGSDGATCASTNFVPIVLDVKDAGSIDWAKAKVKFRYLESDPNKVRQVGPSPKHWHMADGGAIRIWNELLTGSLNPKPVDEDGNWVKSKQYLASKIFESGSTEVTLYIEGIARGPYKTEITAEFDARGDGNWLQDKVHVTVICVDEDVDSDNTRGVRVPERDEYEDRIEDATDKSEYPGKFVGVNDGDVDGDGVIDYADWQIMNGLSFVPYLVMFQEPLDVNKLRLRLTYEGSDPVMTTDGVPPSGKLRLWRKNASTQRDPRPSNAGGDYVAPDEYEGSDLWRLPWASARTVILGMEGVNAADRAQIQVEVDPDGTNGPAQWVHLDAIRLTIIRTDLDIWNGGADLDNGGTGNAGPQGDQVPDADEESVGAYLLVNWDDDDGDGEINTAGSGWTSLPKPDLDESTAITDEDNLAQLKPDLEPMLDTGTVELEVSGADKDKIKLWEKKTKETEVPLTANKKTWDLSNSTQKSEFEDFIANSLWIEGIEEGSAERAVTFTLRYKDSGGTEICNDATKATVVLVKLGSALHREMAGWPENRGHAGLLTGFDGDCTASDLVDSSKYEVTEMQGGPNDCVHTTWKAFHAASSTYWHQYDCSQSYTDRLKVLMVAKYIFDDTGGETEYCVTDVLEPNIWDGDLVDVDSLRCDGLVELAYEWSGLSVWGKIVSGSTHYSIITYTMEHNEFLINWKKHLFPATQCAWESTYKGVDWDTQFTLSDVVRPLGAISW